MRKNVASQRVVFSLFKAGARIENPTIAAGDFKVKLDGGGQNNVATPPTSDAAGIVTWLPSQAETNADLVTFAGLDALGDEWEPLTITFDTTTSTLTQADILSDATPFAGVYIDAAISSIRASVVAAGGTIGTADLPNIVRYVTYDETITGLTIPAGWQTIELTVKETPEDTDANALLNIVESNPGVGTDGLIVIQKQTTAAALLAVTDASLTVNQPAGTVTVHITRAATTKLDDYTAVGFDLICYDGTDHDMLTYGKTNIYKTETR